MLLVALSATAIENVAAFCNELPYIVARSQFELEHAEVMRQTHAAILANRKEASQVAAASANSELQNAVVGVDRSIGILRGEAFVVMDVSVDDDVCIEVIQIAPQWPYFNRLAQFSRTKERSVPERERACGRGLCQIIV